MRSWIALSLLLVAGIARGQEPATDSAPAAGADAKTSPVTPQQGEAQPNPAPPVPASPPSSADDQVIIIDEDAGDDEILIIDEEDDDDQLIIIEDAAPGDEVLVIDDEDEDPKSAESQTSLTLPSFNQMRTWVTAELSSRAMFDFNFDTKTREDVVEWWNLGRLRLDAKTGKNLRAVVEGWVRWGVVAEDTKPDADFLLFNAKNPKWTGEVQLREGYVELGGWDFVLKVGQRIFVWGKNEVYAPADVMNPMDLRYDAMQALSSTKDGKLPIFAIDLAYNFDGTKLQAVVAPFFSAHRLPLFGRDFSLAAPGSDLREQLQGFVTIHPSIEDQVQGALAGTELPEESFENMSLALRATTSWLGWDFGATAYFGWERTPDLVIDDDLKFLAANFDRIQADPNQLIEDRQLREALLRAEQRLVVGERLLSATFDRTWQFALEAEGVVGDFVLRGDLGLAPASAYYDDQLRYHQLPTLSGAVGGEYTYGAEWFISLTLLGIGVFDSPRDAVLIGFEPENRSPKRSDYVSLYGAAAVLRYLWEEQNLQVQSTTIFTLQVGNADQIDPADFVWTAEVAYKDWEPHQFKLGMVFIWGQNGSLGHTYQYNDFIYLQYEGTW